ncbi:MAG: virulence factor [Burkholderiales bacterium]
MRKIFVSLLLSLGLVTISGTAAARGNIDIGISFGIPAPVYIGPPAVAYYQPRPVYAVPPVYYAPPPVYYAPAPVYYGPPVVHRRWHGHGRHHHRRW